MQDQKDSKIQLDTIREVKANSFIFTKDNALPHNLCNEIISRFEADKEGQYQGRIGQTATKETQIKSSTDLVVSGKPAWKDIDNVLFQSLSDAIYEFRKTFTFFQGPFKDMGYALQRTEKEQYYHWHIDGGSHEFSHRQLVAIWYLNNVSGPGGETEFLNQEVKINPERGKLILFPPFWTHEHRGVTLKEGTKYIATTWIVFK